MANLNGAIAQANTATGKTDTVFSLSAGATINTGAESAFTTLLGYETASQVSITDQIITVDSGTISVDNANLLDATTTGTVTASITTTERVDELKTLTAGSNAYTIVIAGDDATGSTAAEFNTINAATSVAIDASAVTGLAVSYTHLTLPTT